MQTLTTGTETTASFASPNIHPSYIQNVFSPMNHYLTKFAISYSLKSKRFQLNAFTLDYCDLQKYFTFMCNNKGPHKQWGKIAAISRYCLTGIVTNGIIQKILLHHIGLFCQLPFGIFKTILPMVLNLGFCPRIWVFNAFLVFLLRIWGF